MKPRPMQLKGYADGVRPYDFHYIYGLMHYPNDPCTAEDYACAIYRWHGCLQSEPALPPTRTLELLWNDMQERRGRASISGLVLLEYLQMRKSGVPTPSLRKAVQVVADLAAVQPLEGRKRAPFPSDAVAIRRSFSREFRSVSHLWLAFMSLDSDAVRLASDKRLFELFLFSANHLAVELSRMSTRSDKAFFWDPPMIPIAGEIEIPTVPEDSLAIIEQYQALDEP